MPGPTVNPGVLVGGASLWLPKGKSDAETAAAWDYLKYLVEPGAAVDVGRGHRLRPGARERRRPVAHQGALHRRSTLQGGLRPAAGLGRHARSRPGRCSDPSGRCGRSTSQAVEAILITHGRRVPDAGGHGTPVGSAARQLGHELWAGSGRARAGRVAGLCRTPSPPRRLRAEDAAVPLGRARDGHRPVQALHGHDGHEPGQHRHRARCRSAPEDGQQLRVPGPAPLLRRRHLPPHHRRVHVPGRRSDRHRPGRARATGSRTSCPSPASTSSARWPWPTPAPTPTAASSSSSAGNDGVRLPPQYSLFGKVVKGIDVVEAMQKVATDRNDRPQRGRRHQLRHHHRSRLDGRVTAPADLHRSSCRRRPAARASPAPGLRRRAPERPGRPPAPAAGLRPRRAHPDRLGERAGALAGAAAVRPPRSPSTGPAAEGRGRRRAVRVLGARGVAHPRRPAPPVPLEDGPGLGRVGVERAGADEQGAPRLRREHLPGGGRARPGRGRRPLGAHRRQRRLVGLGPRQAGARMAVLDRPGHGAAAAERLRPHVRPAGADAARRGCSPLRPRPSRRPARS